MADCQGWADVERVGKANLHWFHKYFPYELGIPSHDTPGRVFRRLDTVEFYACLKSFVYHIVQSLEGRTVAIDGKTLRGYHDKAVGRTALHSFSAWVTSLKMCIGLKSVEDNPTTLTAELNDLLLKAMDSDDKNLRRNRTFEINRGREETREVCTLPAPKHNRVLNAWEGISSIGVVFRTVKTGDKLTEESSLFISSLPNRVKDLAGRVRQHWGIENSQHYTLDVTFAEDASRIRKRTSPEISSVFRRLALNILQRDTSIKDNIRGKRKLCSFSTDAIEQILQQFTVL